MKIGDLVVYRGWQKPATSAPMGIVVDDRSSDSEFHRRVRVMWCGEKIPIQANVLSTSGNRITSWVSPKYFEVISESR